MATSRAPGTRSASKAASEETPTLEASLIATVAPVMRHLVAHARRRRAWSELTYQQYNVLRMIDTMGPQPQAEVARRLLVTAPVVTRLASTLADAGLVERKTDPKDRRAVLLALTPTGRRRARAMRRDLLEAAHDLLEPIPEERRAGVGAALEELQVLLPSHNERGKRSR
ncbi:MAG TPA: MarR family transcriptional regulator [Candidatus Limnocylindria bacterium]|jgi:DNA-binding MarR family transcriptional regulator|nr:MarR family transcriptional regulator [Candidatus Limnocylindria bacterium]